MRPMLRAMIVCAALLPAMANGRVEARDDDRHDGRHEDRHWNGKSIDLVPLGVYNVIPFLFDQGAVEISAYDTSTQDITLDPVAFPDWATIQSRPLGIGRLKVTSFNGDTDGDGDFDKLFPFGARSFSIWSEDGRLVYDSGDELEQITAAAHPLNFNASNTNNTRDDRSDDKGPEPEGVTIAKLFGREYLFVMLERIGGVVLYELKGARAPEFVQYINMRNFAFAPNTGQAGNLGPEAARFISAESSPNGKPLLIVSNEVSGSLRVFEIRKEH